MKRLCLGSLLAVLVHCKANSSSQKEINGTMLLSIDPDDDRRDDDNLASGIIRGKANPPRNVMAKLLTTNPSDVATYFKEHLLKILDNNKKANIVLAIRDIIDNDATILDDTVVDLVSGKKKEDIVTGNYFVFGEFLAGVFLYAINYPSNTASGLGTAIAEVTQEYVLSFDANAGDINVVNDRFVLDGTVADEVVADAHKLALYTDTGGACVKCGRPLAVHRKGTDVNYAHILKIEDQEFIVCGDCESVILAASDDERASLFEEMKSLRDAAMVRDDMARNEIEREIEEILREVSVLEESDDTQLKKSAAPVENKILDPGLKKDILNDVRPLYEGVNDILDRLAGESSINVDVFARRVHRMFEDAEGRMEQEELFNMLVDTLYNKTGHKYKRACRIIISYFVQRCEVFNEITK